MEFPILAEIQNAWVGLRAKKMLIIWFCMLCWSYIIVYVCVSVQRLRRHVPHPATPDFGDIFPQALYLYISLNFCQVLWLFFETETSLYNLWNMLPPPKKKRFIKYPTDIWMFFNTKK